MDIIKAMGIAKSLKNHFRAFEELESFVSAVAASQNYVAELEEKTAALQEEIKALEKEKAEISVAAKGFKESKVKQGGALVEALEGDYLKRKEEISASISKYEARKRDLAEEAAEMETAHAETRQRLEQETAEARATLQTVERKIQAIKTKLE